MFAEMSSDNSPTLSPNPRLKPSAPELETDEAKRALAALLTSRNEKEGSRARGQRLLRVMSRLLGPDVRDSALQALADDLERVKRRKPTR